MPENLELIPEVNPAPESKPVRTRKVKAPVSAEAKLRAANARIKDLESRLDAANNALDQHQGYFKEMQQAYEDTQKKLHYQQSYNRAALSNIVDQLTVTQRMVNILMAGGDE